mgnify:CR=1 FL=1
MAADQLAINLGDDRHFGKAVGKEVSGLKVDVLGEAQMRSEQWKDAEKSLLKSYDINSYNAETLYSLGQVYKKLGKLDRSLEYLKKFKEIEEFERNTESLNKRIRLHPDDLTLRLELATLYEHQKRIDQAVMILRQAAYLGSIEAEKKLKTLLEKK